MASITSLGKDDFEHLRFPAQINFFSNSPVNRAFTVIAQAVMGLLQQSYAFQAVSINLS